MMKYTYKQRRAFTLTELMVAIGIIGFIFGLFWLFMPTFGSQQRSGNGAALLQQWLLTAKQRALYDRQPRGLRLIRELDTTNNTFTNYIKQAQYIEQPDDFTGGTATATGNKVTLAAIDVTGGQDPNNPALWPVQVGDYFQFHNAGLMHRIAVITPKSASSSELQLESPVAIDVTLPNSSYRIVRQPRPLGDETLQLPLDVVIDLTPNFHPAYKAYKTNLPFNPPNNAEVDVMFSPKGMVLGNFASDQMIFWVRDLANSPDWFRGNPSLIVVFTRSGLIESYEIDDRNTTNPFSKVPGN